MRNTSSSSHVVDYVPPYRLVRINLTGRRRPVANAYCTVLQYSAVPQTVFFKFLNLTSFDSYQHLDQSCSRKLLLLSCKLFRLLVLVIRKVAIVY